MACAGPGSIAVTAPAITLADVIVGRDLQTTSTLLLANAPPNPVNVTLTVNAVDPEIGAKVYSWIRDDKRPFRGVTGARILLERQLEAVRRLTAHGILVKINSVMIPSPL